MPNPDQEAFLGQWGHTLAPSTLGYRVKLLAQLLGRRLQERLEPFGLTPFHWAVLCCLWAEDGLPPSVLCTRLDQEGGTLTGVLRRMQERALIRRAQDPLDHRIWRVWLTPTGQQLQNQLPPLVDQLQQQATAGLSNREYNFFCQILYHLLRNLEEASP